jgi:hypothetical protein
VPPSWFTNPRMAAGFQLEWLEEFCPLPFLHKSESYG